MPNDEQAATPRDDPHVVYAAWLQTNPVDDGAAFDRFCAEHPALVKELRKLHEVAKLAQSLASSPSFHHSVRDAFGEEAEVKFTLDEGPTDAEDNTVTMVTSAAKPLSEAIADLQVSDRYTLHGEVARGGMGIIYKVRDRELNRTLAMKVMLGAPPTTSTEKTSHPLLTRFLEEVQVTAQLDHPGIVAVHELGLDAAGRPYFTMKLVKGRDLSQIFELARAEREDWNLARAVGALIKACQAVAFAHMKGVIHRDLKPANVMVGRFGEVYVMDWGLAKVTGRKDLHDLRLAPASRTTVTEIQTPRGASGSTTADSPLITMDGSVVGTPAYMPPEQARGQVEEVDQSSDIYSLGAILYNLLTGQAPYVEPGARISPHTILARVLDGPPKRVHTLNPKAPAELVAICEKAMAREKRDRYPSSLDLAEDLQAWLDRRVVKAYRTGAVAEFKSWVARNKGVAVTAGAAALLLVLGGTAFIIQQKRANERLRLNSYVAEMSVAGHALDENNLARAAELLNRQRPQPREKDLRGFEWRYLWERTRGHQLYSFPGHRKYVAALAFSPSGRLLASASWDNQIQVVDLVSKQFIATLTNVTSGNGWIHRYSLAFSPDGKTLAVHFRQGVRLYDTSNWKELKVLTDTWIDRYLPHFLTPLAFSPDGGTLAAWEPDATRPTTSDEGKIVFWDTRTWTLKPLSIKTNLLGFGCLVAYSPDGKRLATGSVGSDSAPNGQIQLWEAETGRLLEIAPIPSPVSIASSRNAEKTSAPPDRNAVPSPVSIAFSRDSRWFAVGTADGNVWLWEGANLRMEPKRFKADSSELFGLVFSADSQRLFTSGADQVVRVWDLATLRQLRLLQGHASEMWSLAVSPDGRLLAGGTRDGPVVLWDTESGTGEVGFADDLLPLAFSPDGRALLTGGTNFTFTWFDLDAKRPISSVNLPIQSTNAALKTVSIDGTMAAVAVSAHQLEIWNLPRAQHRITLSNDIATFGRLRFSPDNQLLVADCVWPRQSEADSSIRSRTAEVWEVASGRHVGSFTNLASGNGLVAPLAVSMDCRMIAGETFDARAKVVRLGSTTEVIFPLGEKTHLTEAAFSPDGKLLATSGYDGDARLWEVQTGQLRHRLSGHKQSVFCIAFSPDGRTLVSGSRNGDVKFWNVATGGELLSLRLSAPEDVWGAMFSPDGRTLVLQNTRHILRVPTMAEIDALETAKR